MPDIFIYAIVGGVVFLVLLTLVVVKAFGLKPKRGPSSFSHDSHWDSNSSL